VNCEQTVKKKREEGWRHMRESSTRHILIVYFVPRDFFGGVVQPELSLSPLILAK